MHPLPQTAPPLHSEFLISFHALEEMNPRQAQISPDNNDEIVRPQKKVLPQVPHVFALNGDVIPNRARPGEESAFLF